MRATGVDRPLLLAAAGLMLYGLVILYSAGQTDIVTQAHGVWYRQFLWLGVGLCAAYVTFKTSLRLLEWGAPALYGFSLLLLIAVLVVGTGAGTAESSKNFRMQ